MRFSVRVCTVAVFAVVAVAATSASTTTAAPQTSFASNALVRIAVPSEVPPLDPQKRDNLWLRIATDSIYQPLLERASPSGRLQPILAETLPKQIRPRVWRFKLRKGITFTNGEPFNARAAALSIARIVDKNFESEWASLVETIAGARARGTHTVDVVTRTPDVLLPSRMPVIKMVPPNAARRDDFATRPVGTGPYRWVSGSGLGPIALTRNTRYWGARAGLPAGTIQRVLIRAIPDVSTRISALKAGEVDLVTVLPPDSAGNVPKAITAAGIENPTVVLNSMAGLTADVRVRRALNYAVDKQAIARQLFRGYADVSRCQGIAPASVGYNVNLKPYAYDVARARQLLQQAGAIGKTVTLVSSDVFTKGRELAQVIAAYWEAAGLNVKVEVPEFSAYLDALYAKGAAHPDGVYVSTSTDLLDGSAAARQLASDGIQSVYRNPQVDRLFTQAAAQGDVDKRAAIYKQLFSTACNDAALLNLLHPRDIYGAARNLNWAARFDSKMFFETMTVRG